MASIDVDSGRLKLFALEASCLALGFHILAYYEEDSGEQASIVASDCASSGKIRYTIISSGACDWDSLDALMRSLPLILRAPLRRFTIDCKQDSGREGLRYEDISRRIINSFRANVSSELQRLAWSGVEYFYAVGWNGEYALGPGSEHEVRLPLLPVALFAHTHPGSLCYPSWRDLRSFAEFLASGGIGEFISSTSCSYTVILRKPFTSGCYEDLLRVSRCAERTGGRELTDYLACLSELSSIDCIYAGVI